jgi:hypothetical protein
MSSCTLKPSSLSAEESALHVIPDDERVRGSHTEKAIGYVEDPGSENITDH